MQTINKTYTILGHEFELDELKDIVNHGMAMGVSGFIYYHENTALFNEYEDDIEAYLSDWYHDNMGEDNYIHAMTEGRSEIASIDALKNHMVWAYVELNAHEILCRVDADYWLLNSF